MIISTNTDLTTEMKLTSRSSSKRRDITKLVTDAFWRRPRHKHECKMPPPGEIPSGTSCAHHHQLMSDICALWTAPARINQAWPPGCLHLSREGASTWHPAGTTARDTRQCRHARHESCGLLRHRHTSVKVLSAAY